MFAEISVVSYAGTDTKKFTYKLGAEKVVVGSLVALPFGKRRTYGVIRKIIPKVKTDYKVVSITKVLDLPPLPEHLLTLSDWMIEYYASSAQAVWRMVLPKSLGTKSRATTPPTLSKKAGLVELTSDQQAAFKKIIAAKKPILLQGVTGSGKTEVYLHTIKEQLKLGRSTVFLLPEILLTEHITGRIQKNFPKQIIITHSGLTPAKRWSQWQQIINRSQTEPLIIIGPRSAIFSPLHNLGQIIIDEEHEPSYKQESSPYYHAREIAGKIHQLQPTRVILGSATPSISTRFLADQKRLESVELTERFATELPDIAIEDLRDSNEIISPKLFKAMQTTLNNNKQVLLFLNRRGSASKYLCTHCGHVFACRQCGASLHFHADTTKLHCHVCAWYQPTPATCPECGEAELKLTGIGTKRLEAEVKKLFPEHKVLRIDRDNFKPKDLPAVAKQLQQKQVEIIIGTQMIGRGLDLEHLHLVGVIQADTELNLADFSSAERAFQLISQAAGRAGRRTPGTVIIQTYRPDNSILAAVKGHSYETYYNQELALRKEFTYPPFGYLLKLTCAFAKASTAQSKAMQLIQTLEDHKEFRALGPVSAYPPMRNGKYRMQVVVISKSRPRLRQLVNALPSFWTAELDPLSLI